MQTSTSGGLSETEVSARAGIEATAAMLDAIGPIYRAQSQWFEGAVAGYRGQIGRGAAIPHALAGNVVFQPGDVLVTGATTPVWGYHSELERTMVICPGPFLDRGDGTEIRPGMVFTVEPGLYAAGLGGFRHSDTVVVRDDGLEFLTNYPRDLETLTLPA